MAMHSTLVGVCNCLHFAVNAFGYPVIFFVVSRDDLAHAFVIEVLHALVAYIIDHCNSDNLRNNLEIMKQAGFSPLKIWSSAAVTWLGTPLGAWVLLISMASYNPEWELLTVGHFSPQNLVTALLLVFSTDICFFAMHKLLHERFPMIHRLHHCCVHSSLCTNLFFDPADLAMEFSAPVAVIWAVSNFLFDDPWMFVLSLGILQGWYAMTHDEWLSLPHTKHHRDCATGYFIYFNYFYADPKREQVRKLVPFTVRRSSSRKVE
jgi:hypothetical protein